MPGRTRRAASDYGRPSLRGGRPFCCRSDGLLSGCCIGMEAGIPLRGRCRFPGWKRYCGCPVRRGLFPPQSLSFAVSSLLHRGLFSQLRPFFRRGHHRSAVVFASLLPGDAAEQGRPERSASVNGTAASRCGETAVCGSGSGRKRCPPGMEANGACLQSAVRGAVHRRGLRRCGACRSAPRWAIRRRFRP